MKKSNLELLNSLEEKILNGSIQDDELKLYSRWYSWRQNNKIEVEEEIATSFTQHKGKLFDKIIDELDGSGESFRQFYKYYLVKYKITKSIFRYSTAAACLGIVVFLGILFFSKKGKIFYDRENDVAPGKSGLVLTLDDGRKIMLDSIKDGLLAVQQGVSVFKKNGHIEYEGKGVSELMNTATTDVGRQYQVILPDSSIVWLNAQSELKYPISFTSTERHVYLKGEAYFEVTHQQNNIPFVVETVNKNIKVMGTHFNLCAYKDQDDVVATLLEGSIAMQTSTNTKFIHPDQAAISSYQSTTIDVKNVVASNAIMWVHQEFNFEDRTLDDIMKMISRWYGIKVVYKDESNRFMRFMGSTPMNKNLSEVLEVLKFSGLHFHLENKVLSVLP